MNKIKISMLVIAVIVMTLVVKSLTMDPLPEPEYKFYVSNTGYILYDGDKYLGYVDYEDTDHLVILNKIRNEEDKKY